MYGWCLRNLGLTLEAFTQQVLGLSYPHVILSSSSYLLLQEGTSVDDARRFLQGRPLRAHIPPHHVWGVPSQSQRISFKLYLHGTPIEIFSTPCPIDQGEKMVKQLNFQQTELSKYAVEQQDDTLSPLPPVPIYSSTRLSLWLPTTDTQTCKIGMAHKRGLSLDDDITLSQFAPLCKRLVCHLPFLVALITTLESSLG